MAKNKVTLNDVAKEANVSLATASYALNHSDKEKISHSTRLKVFAAAKKLNYCPNVSYHFSERKKSNLIGIVMNLDSNNSMFKMYYYYNIASGLQRHLSQIGYHSVIISSNELGKDKDVLSKIFADGIFIIDADVTKYKKVTQGIYVPIIFLDSEIDDDLFYKILPDYKKCIAMACALLNESEPFIVLDNYINTENNRVITENIPQNKIFINDKNSDIKKFLENQDSCGIVIGELLGLQVSKFYDNEKFVVINFSDEQILPENIKEISFNMEALIKTSIEIMMSLINFHEDENSSKKIYINPRE